MTARPKSEIDKHIAAVRELQRLTALLEDRPTLIQVLHDARREWQAMGEKPGLAEFQADRIRVYLKGVKSNSFT